jgi:ABC-type transport system involved in cytochrome c biogenesis permease component
MRAFVRAVWVVTRKDILIETRTREIVFTTLFFALACVMVFAFGFVKEGRPMDDVAAGILWIAIAFSGTLALGRAFERERQGETLRALLIAPIDRPALYVGKLLGILILLAVVEILIVPLVALMFQARAVRAPAADDRLAGRGTLGSPPSGRCLRRCWSGRAAATSCCRCCLYPITVPVIIAGVRGTAALLQPARICRWRARGCRCCVSSTWCSSRWRCGRSSR